mgnify:CR=1 FL=1
MPSSPLEYQMICQICEIISSIVTDSKDPKAMQKVAADIEAIEKINGLLLNHK